MKSKTSRFKIFLLIMLADLLVSMMLVPTGFAARVGVRKGNWVKYSNFTGTNVTVYDPTINQTRTVYVPPNLWNLTWDIPDYWPENNAEWVSMTVQSVSSTNVTVLSTTHFKDGTEEDKTLSGDVTTGLGDLGFFLIEANLEEGDEVPWDHTEVTGAGAAGIKLYINGTVTREYAGVSREVNYVNVIIPPGLAMATYVNLTAYWDKATGVLCEISMSVTFGPLRISYGFIDALTAFKMTETNVFAPPSIWTEWWFWTIIAVIVIVVAGSGILIRRRGKATSS